MALFPASASPSALAVLGVVVLLPLTLAARGIGLAALWLCDRVCWPLSPPAAPLVPDVDTETEYGWAQSSPTER